MDYDRNKIAERIVQLREEHKSFSMIAAILNAEGYKPRQVESFSQATVFQMHKSAIAMKKLGTIV